MAKSKNGLTGYELKHWNELVLKANNLQFDAMLSTMHSQHHTRIVGFQAKSFGCLI